MGSKLCLSTSNNPRTDGETESGGKWKELLPLIEFACNNSYHASIRMESYEDLYGRKFRTPLCWTEVSEERILGPEIILKTTKKIRMICEKMKESHDHQKSYVDN